MKSLICIVVLLSLVLSSGCISEPSSRTTYKDIPIYSLDRDMATSGHFVWGTGSVNSYPVYLYYTRNQNNGYKLEYIRSSTMTIYMDEEDQPYVRLYYKVRVSGHNIQTCECVYDEFSEISPCGCNLTVKKDVYSDNRGYITTMFDNDIQHIYEGYLTDSEMHLPNGSIPKVYSP